MLTFILAAGESVRWNGEGRKQLVEVDGVPIMQRTLTCLESLKPSVVFKICDRFYPAQNCYEIPAQPTTRDTVLFILRATPKNALILFGDVYYDDEQFWQFTSFQHGERIVVWTDTQDIFAIYIPISLFHIFEKACHEVKTDQNPRMWPVVFRLQKTHLEALETIEVCNRTQDFDTLEDYENFQKGITKNRLLAQKLYAHSKELPQSSRNAIYNNQS